MTLIETTKTYAFIPLSIALVLSIFLGLQPDATHQCYIEETERYCFAISGGLHTRCYLDVEKSTWDYCKGGWQPISEWAPMTINPDLDVKKIDGTFEIWKRIKIYSEKDLNDTKKMLDSEIKRLKVEQTHFLFIEQNLFNDCLIDKTLLHDCAMEVELNKEYYANSIIDLQKDLDYFGGIK